MPVKTPVQADFTTETDASQYKTDLEVGIGAAGQYAWQFAPHEAATPNMTVVMEGGYLFAAATLQAVSQQTSGTITAPTTNPRIDALVLNIASQTVAVITGTEAASPLPPAISDIYMPLAYIALSVSQTEITNQNLTDIRPLLVKFTAVPVGAVFSAPTVLEGFIKGNGALVSRTTYADLFAYANDNGLIVSEATWASNSWGLFGAGDGSTTFRLPDLRGEFLRGFDDGRGVDSGRSLGVYQADQIKSHNHSLNVWQDSGPTYNALYKASTLAGTTTTGSTGGSENRVRNIAYYMQIKY